MFVLRQWWNRYALKTGVVVLAVASAWFMRATEGTALYEAYHWITRPMQPNLNRDQVLENTYILELQQRIVELENQNRSLRKFEDYVDTLAEPGIRARVIGHAADHWWQHLILSRGSRQGVEVGHIVTAPGGAVGRVVAVSPNTSKVLLITDATSRVGAKVSRSRVLGVVRGQSNDRLVMEFFEKDPDVRVGDVIVTSSYSRLFPSELSIGRVEFIDMTKSPAPEAVIQLSAPSSIIEWVVISPFDPMESVDDPTVSNPEDNPEGNPWPP